MTDPPSDGPSTTPARQRFTLDVIVWAGVILVLSWSLIGLGAAALGWFRPLPVLVGTALVTGWLCWWVLPRVRSGSASTRPHWALMTGMIVLVLASGLWNGANHGEHLIAERDPGMYTTAALWLTNHGELRIDKPTGAFQGSDAVNVAQNGFDLNTHGSFDSWWPDLNAVYLAGAAWGGNSWIFFVPAVLTSLVLFMLFMLGCRLGSPMGGAFAAIALAVSFPFIYVARDQFSEPLAMLLLLSGLWALTYVPKCGVRVAIIAGALLGSTSLARIDGLIPIVPLVGVLTLQITLARRQKLERRADTFAAVLLALSVTVLMGVVETWQFAQGYFHTRLLPRLPILLIGMICAALAGRILGSSHYRYSDKRYVPTRGLKVGFAVFGCAAAAIVIWARFIRPDIQGVRDALARGVREYWTPPGDHVLRYWGKTLSYLWIEWYLGPLLMIGGIAALLWLMWRGLHSRSREVLPVAAVGITVTLGYLISPQVGPDLPWATRRFVVASIPLMFLALGLALGHLGRLRPPISRWAVGVFALACLFFPIRATIPLADTAVGRSLADRYDQICRIANEQPSAILVTSKLDMARTVPLGLREWCNLPVAGARADITPTQVRQLKQDWAASGRRLLLLTTTPEGLAGVSGSATRIKGPPLLKPEATTTRVSDHIVPNQFLLDFPQPSGGSLPMYVIDPTETVSPGAVSGSDR